MSADLLPLAFAVHIASLWQLYGGSWAADRHAWQAAPRAVNEEEGGNRLRRLAVRGASHGSPAREHLHHMGAPWGISVAAANEAPFHFVQSGDSALPG